MRSQAFSRARFAAACLILVATQRLGAQEHAPDPLQGLWRVELRTTLSGGGTSSQAPVSTGLIGLFRTSRPIGNVWSSLARPTHYGVYNIGTDAFGSTDPRLIQSVAGAQLRTADSVVVVLNPGPDHGAIVLNGRLLADSIVGSWQLTAYFQGVAGHFSMRRIVSREDLVDLAEPYVYTRLVLPTTATTAEITQP